MRCNRCNHCNGMDRHRSPAAAATLSANPRLKKAGAARRSKPTGGVDVAAEGGHRLRQADCRLLAQHHEAHEDEELGGQGLQGRGA